MPGSNISERPTGTAIEHDIMSYNEKGSSRETYVVAGCKPWNRRVYDETIRQYPGVWHYVASPEELSLERLQQLRPRFIFFLHWSWKISEDLLNRFECVCFHMTDVPYGRGGSPLQNLIVRGHRDTRLTALRMCADFDAGPVYLKEPLSLEGSAEEIYLRATRLSATMIRKIIADAIIPVPQSGEVTIFRRRKPAESEIPELRSLEQFYDYIRMLDAEGYPKAFLRYRGFRLEFSRASLHDGRLVAEVQITAEEREGSQ